MSVIGEGQTPEQVELKADSEYFRRTASALYGIIEEERNGVVTSVRNGMDKDQAQDIEGTQAQRAKVARSQEMRATAHELRGRGDASTARVLETMGFAIEASQADEPEKRVGAQKDLADKSLLNARQSQKFAEYVDGLRAVRTADPSGHSYIDFMHDQMSRMDTNDDPDGALTLAVETATAWSMKDMTYADDVYALMKSYIAEG